MLVAPTPWLCYGHGRQEHLRRGERPRRCERPGHGMTNSTRAYELLLSNARSSHAVQRLLQPQLLNCFCCNPEVPVKRKHLLFAVCMFSSTSVVATSSSRRSQDKLKFSRYAAAFADCATGPCLLLFVATGRGGKSWACMCATWNINIPRTSSTSPLGRPHVPVMSTMALFRLERGEDRSFSSAEEMAAEAAAAAEAKSATGDVTRHPLQHR